VRGRGGDGCEERLGVEGMGMKRGCRQ
jgi:hypothetical protein